MRTVLLAVLSAATAFALNPSLPPSGNFDLTHWNLTLPVDSNGGSSGAPVTIDTATLGSGYTSSYFFTGADGAMVFYCPAVGAHTSGSTHPRTELRQLLNPNSGMVEWLGDGSHHLSGSLEINSLAAYPDGEVAIAQIHGYANGSYGLNTPFVLLKYDAQKNPAEVWASVQYLASGAADPNHGNKTGAHLGFGTAALNSRIGYTIEARNGTVYVTLTGTSIPGTQSVGYYGNDAAWKGVPLYFKAGNYYVANDGTTAARLACYSLATGHVVLVSDDFSSSNAATDRASWFAHDTATLNVTNHTLVLTAGGTALTYFTGSTAEQLAMGDTLQATFTLTLQGATFPNTNDILRVALLNSCSTRSPTGGNANNPTSPQRVSADGYAVSSSTFDRYTGYMAGVNLHPTSASAIKLYSRTPATKSNNGIVSTASYTQITPTGGEGGNYGFTAGKTYTGTLTAHRDVSSGAVTVTMTFIGDGGAYWRYSLADNLGGTPTYTFDTLVFYLATGTGITSATLDNIAVTYSLHP